MSRTFRRPRLPTEDGGTPKFVEFAGVVNTRSRKDIGTNGLVTGTNVLLSDSKKITRVPGYQLMQAGNARGVYGRDDRLYVVFDDELLYMPYGDVNAAVVVVTGLTGKAFSWEEVNGDVHYVNGVDAGIVRGAQHLPWRLAAPSITSVEVVSAAATPSAPLNLGASYAQAKWRVIATYLTVDGRETAPSEVVEIDASVALSALRITVPPQYAATNIYCTLPDGDSTDFRRVARTTSSVVTVDPRVRSTRWMGRHTFPMPDGIERITYWGGSFYGAVYMPSLDASVVWCSEPFAPHLWRPADKGFMMRGRVPLLVAVKDGIVVGSTDRIHFFDGDKFPELANYGVVPGEAGDTTQEGVAYFWTTRGICKAMPFENLSEATLSVPPGSRAHVKLLYMNGMMQFVAVTDGTGVPFNQRNERT